MLVVALLLSVAHVYSMQKASHQSKSLVQKDGNTLERPRSGLAVAFETLGGVENLPLQSPRNEYGLDPDSLVANIFNDWAIRLERAHRKKYPKAPLEDLRKLSPLDWSQLELAIIKKYGEEFDATKKSPFVPRKNKAMANYDKDQQREGLLTLLGVFMSTKEKMLRLSPEANTSAEIFSDTSDFSEDDYCNTSSDDGYCSTSSNDSHYSNDNDQDLTIRLDYDTE